MYPYPYEKTNNFIKMHDWFPFRSTYCYLDTEDYTADQFFARRQFPIKFLNREYKRPDSPFVFVMVRFPTRCEPGFEEVMCELRRAILAKGYTGYDELCDEVQGYKDKIEEERKKK